MLIETTRNYWYASMTCLNAMQPRFDRGYTGHSLSRCKNGKHMCGFGLINMPACRSVNEGRKGRWEFIPLQSGNPYLQRFLSPDPFIISPTNAQDYNRYSYVLNNPLMYTDPSGYSRITSQEDAEAARAANQNYWNVYFRDMDHLFVGTGGNGTGIIGLPGQGLHGRGANGIYYDWYSNVYRSTINPTSIISSWSIANSTAISSNSFSWVVGEYWWQAEGFYDQNENFVFSRKVDEGYYLYLISTPRNHNLNISENGWGNTISRVIDVNTGLGGLSGLFAGNYGLTANQTFKYGLRQGGKIISSSRRTAMHFSHSMNVARSFGRVNLITGTIGVAYSTNQVISDYNEGGWEDRKSVV